MSPPSESLIETVNPGLGDRDKGFWTPDILIFSSELVLVAMKFLTVIDQEEVSREQVRVSIILRIPVHVRADELTIRI